MSMNVVSSMVNVAMNATILLALMTVAVFLHSFFQTINEGVNVSDISAVLSNGFSGFHLDAFSFHDFCDLK